MLNGAVFPRQLSVEQTSEQQNQNSCQCCVARLAWERGHVRVVGMQGRDAMVVQGNGAKQDAVSSMTWNLSGLRPNSFCLAFKRDRANANARKISVSAVQIGITDVAFRAKVSRCLDAHKTKVPRTSLEFSITCHSRPICLMSVWETSPDSSGNTAKLLFRSMSELHISHSPLTERCTAGMRGAGLVRRIGS